jgi:6-phosphogluconolactonase/glucosamine-6-phosphate isomerase/deaminase
VWLVCGAEKSEVVADVIDDRTPTPAARVLNGPAASVFLDVEAARLLSVT